MSEPSNPPDEPDAAPVELPVRTVTNMVVVELEIVRATSRRILRVEVPAGSPVRRALRAAGYPAEGSAVLEGDRPVPLDRPVTASVRFTVLPTFSGG